MFGRKPKRTRNRVIHTPECTAIHEAMLMSLYLGYGAPSAPLFVPSGGLTCTCDQGGADSAPPRNPTNDTSAAVLERTLISA